jgi:hypothetical protein
MGDDFLALLENEDEQKYNNQSVFCRKLVMQKSGNFDDFYGLLDFLW